MKRHIHYDVFISIGTALIGVFFLVGSLSFPKDIGYFPRIFSVLLIVCSLFVLADGIKRSKELDRAAATGEAPKLDFTGHELLQAALGFAVIAVYAALIGILGFFTSTAVFLMGFMYFLRMRNWKVMIAVTVGVVLVVYFVFTVQLQVSLPHGLLI